MTFIFRLDWTCKSLTSLRENPIFLWDDNPLHPPPELHPTTAAAGLTLCQACCVYAGLRLWVVERWAGCPWLRSIRFWPQTDSDLNPYRLTSHPAVLSTCGSSSHPDPHPRCHRSIYYSEPGLQVFFYFFYFILQTWQQRGGCSVKYISVEAEGGQIRPVRHSVLTTLRERFLSKYDCVCFSVQFCSSLSL